MIQPSSTSSIEETKQHANRLLGPLAHKLGFEYIAFNQTSSCHDTSASGKAEGKRVTLDIVRGAKGTPGLEPAPITSSDTESFELIGSTIKKVFGEDVIVAPSAVSLQSRVVWAGKLILWDRRCLPIPVSSCGSYRTSRQLTILLTDTRAYWNLTRNLYRFAPTSISKRLVSPFMSALFDSFSLQTISETLTPWTKPCPFGAI